MVSLGISWVAQEHKKNKESGEILSMQFVS